MRIINTQDNTFTESLSVIGNISSNDSLLARNNLITGGPLSKISGKYSTAEGISVVIGNNSHAEGFYSGVINTGAHAEGSRSFVGLRYTYSAYTAATRTLTFSPGITANMDLYASFTPGTSAIFYSTAPVRFEPVIIESRDSSTGSIVLTKDVVGSNTSSSVRFLVLPSIDGGTYGHAEGYETRVSGDYGHAEGRSSWAHGQGSHAEGFSTAALGSHSHTEGVATAAHGESSHAEGYNTIAKGNYSHAAGVGAEAVQDFTYAWSDANHNTSTANISTTRTGQYMVSASGGIFFPGNVGIGTDSIDNALTVEGNISASGVVYTAGGSSDSWNSFTASISTLNLDVYSNEIHVSQVDGDDITGTGYILNPVATISKATTLVTANKRKIIVHSGGYNESPTLSGIYTTLTSEQQKGDDVIIYGTVNTAVGCTIAGLKMTNLNITTPALSGAVNVLGCDISGTLTKSATTSYTLIRFCDIGTVNITGAGLVAMLGGNPNRITINNAAAQVIVKTATTIAPVLSAGNANFVDSIVIAGGASSNAVSTAAGTGVTLANSQIIVPAYNNVARVSLKGFYSIFNCTYDKPNSTLVTSSGTGGSTNSIDYFQHINADKVITPNGNSDNWNSGYTTLNSISSIIPDPATTISSQIGVGTTTLNSIDFLNTSSAQLLYTVPAGKTFLASNFFIIIDTVTGGNVADTSLPTFRLYRSDTLTNAANQVTNQLNLTTPSSLITTNRYYRIGGSVAASNGKALVYGDDASPQNKVWFRVESTGTNTYTGLSGRVVATGILL